MKRRIRLLCFGAGCAMLFYAMPRFSFIHETGVKQLFAIGWFTLAMLVIAANLYQMQHSRKVVTEKEKARLLRRLRQQQAWKQGMKDNQPRVRTRS